MKEHDLSLTVQIGEDKKLVCVCVCVHTPCPPPPPPMPTFILCCSLCGLQLLEALEASQKNSRCVLQHALEVDQS